MRKTKGNVSLSKICQVFCLPCEECAKDFFKTQKFISLVLQISFSFSFYIAAVTPKNYDHNFADSFGTRLHYVNILKNNLLVTHQLSHFHFTGRFTIIYYPSNLVFNDKSRLLTTLTYKYKIALSNLSARKTQNTTSKT